MKFNKAVLLGYVVTSLSYAHANAPTESEVNGWLKRFNENSAQVMDELPPKSDSSFLKKFFEDEIIKNRAYVTNKDELRKKLFPQAAASGRAAIERNDRPENLVDNVDNMLTTLEEMEKLKSAHLPVQPWSDDYWAMYAGVLGRRYADDQMPVGNWKTSFDYVTKKRTTFSILNENNSSSLDKLSPAEKYDLLIGSKDFVFSNANWDEGRSYYEDTGKVEKWMGICHGWAPAAFMLPRAEKKIYLKSADGSYLIPFYPADIKAFGSLLWANAGSYNTRFIGGRCSDKNPRKDKNGRVKSQDCFDNNPGTFHMALVNQIGVSKRSFVLDATFDYEVWNQPIYSYSYTYFNPKTREAAATLSKATISLDDFTNDKFSEYRASRAKSVVGIAMKVEYMVETSPEPVDLDTPERDAKQEVTYYYDLELDAHGTIIGGEWYQNTHPDFLWTTEPDERAVSSYDSQLRGKWDARKPLPESWQEAAQASARDNTPLAAIVEKMILESKIQDPKFQVLPFESAPIDKN